MGTACNTIASRCPFWSEKVLQELQCVSVPVGYRKGSTVLHPEKQSGLLYMVESGVLNCRYFTKDGDAMTIFQKRPGDMFGVGVLNFYSEKDYYVEAGTDVRLWKIPEEEFLNLMRSNFEFTQSIMKYFVRYIDSVEGQIKNSVALSYYQRMVLALIDCAENIENNTAVVKTTQQELAELLTVSRQSISTYLSKLSVMGIVEIKRGKILVCDWARLNEERE